MELLEEKEELKVQTELLEEERVGSETQIEDMQKQLQGRDEMLLEILLLKRRAEPTTD